jgi:hypothetical protein
MSAGAYIPILTEDRVRQIIREELAAHGIKPPVPDTPERRAERERQDAHTAALMHLFGVELLHDDLIVRDAALALIKRTKTVGRLQMTNERKQINQCTVDDLGVRLIPCDPIIQGAQALGSNECRVGNVGVDLVHESSLSFGVDNQSVGDGSAGGAEEASPVTTDVGGAA